jgi:DNA-binding winged helix-turn-helix (wHTH) protein
MDVLVFLMEHPGEVLSRETIIDAVWSEQFVGEAVIRRAIASLRRALGDDARNPRFIETIPKRGYRLIAPVEHLGMGDDRTGRTAPAGENTDSAAVIGPEAEGPPLAPPDFVCSVRYGDRGIRLAEGENVIGRTPESRVQVAHHRVSRRHARIVVKDGRATLEDLGSKNGTYLRGERIDEPSELSDGDEIRVGRVTLTFRGLYTARTPTDRGPWGDDIEGGE